MSISTPEPWQFSHAKEILVQEIFEGKVTENSNPDIVYNSNEEYKRYKKGNFKSNLKSLLKSLYNKEERSQFDAAAIVHDTALFPRRALTTRGYPFWDTSEAKVLLVKDVDDGLDLQFEPKDLWLSQEAYQIFPFDVFKKHIHQERSRRTQSSYWHRKKRTDKNKTK
jgi:hypothetical protein